MVCWQKWTMYSDKSTIKTSMASSRISWPWSWQHMSMELKYPPNRVLHISQRLGGKLVVVLQKPTARCHPEATWCGQIGQFFILPENEHPKNVDLTGNTGKQQQQSLRSLIIMTGSIAIRYCWYYYYAQTATPAAAAATAATPSWNCKDHIQVTCGFHDVSQALFSSGTCTVDGTCPCPKKDPSFQQDCQTMEYDDTPGVR